MKMLVPVVALLLLSCQGTAADAYALADHLAVHGHSMVAQARAAVAAAAGKDRVLDQLTSGCALDSWWKHAASHMANASTASLRQARSGAMAAQDPGMMKKMNLLRSHAMAAADVVALHHQVPGRSSRALLQGDCPSIDVCEACLTLSSSAADLSEDEQTSLLVACLVAAADECANCPWEDCEAVENLVADITVGGTPSDNEIEAAAMALSTYMIQLAQSCPRGTGEEDEGGDGECTGDGECEACIEFVRVAQEVLGQEGDSTEEDADQIVEALVACLTTVPSTCSRCQWSGCDLVLGFIETLAEGETPSEDELNAVVGELVLRVEGTLLDACEADTPPEDICTTPEECDVCVDFLEEFMAVQGGSGNETLALELLTLCTVTAVDSCPACGWVGCELVAEIGGLLQAGSTPTDEQIEDGLLALLTHIEQELLPGCEERNSTELVTNTCNTPEECAVCLEFLQTLDEDGNSEDEELSRQLLSNCMETAPVSCPACKWTNCTLVEKLVTDVINGEEPSPEEFESAIIATLIHVTNDLAVSCTAEDGDGDGDGDGDDVTELATPDLVPVDAGDDDGEGDCPTAEECDQCLPFFLALSQAATEGIEGLTDTRRSCLLAVVDACEGECTNGVVCSLGASVFDAVRSDDELDAIEEEALTAVLSLHVTQVLLSDCSGWLEAVAEQEDAPADPSSGGDLLGNLGDLLTG